MSRKKKPKASASRLACALPWCCALAEPDGTSCAVHRLHPALRLKDGSPLAQGDANPDCHTCGGEGECHECEGGGRCYCHCGDRHDCHACSGSGKCPDCKRGDGISRQEREQRNNYLRFAFDPGWQPFDADREYEAMSRPS